MPEQMCFINKDFNFTMWNPGIVDSKIILLEHCSYVNVSMSFFLLNFEYTVALGAMYPVHIYCS